MKKHKQQHLKEHTPEYGFRGDQAPRNEGSTPYRSRIETKLDDRNERHGTTTPTGTERKTHNNNNSRKQTKGGRGWYGNECGGVEGREEEGNTKGRRGGRRAQKRMRPARMTKTTRKNLE